jgi:hypothetical protein
MNEAAFIKEDNEDSLLKNKLEKLVFVNRLFSGKIANEKRCTGCNHVTSSKSDFFYLNLPLHDEFDF